MEWCDNNPDVVEWSSETIVIPYICRTDSKPHRYFMDFKIKYKSGKVVLVEVKPASQVRKPTVSKSKKTQTILTEAYTYAKNRSKWDAAEEYCRSRGWTFQIWTEDVLKNIGLKMANRSNLKK